MFTGIIEDIGEILKIKKSGDRLFYISTKINYKSLKIGSSISCNGVCLTIIKREKKKKKIGLLLPLLKKHYRDQI